MTSRTCGGIQSNSVIWECGSSDPILLMAAGSTDGAVLERGCKISYSFHQSASLGNLGLRSMCKSLWGSLLATGASQHVPVQYLGLDPGLCPAVTVLCATLWVWHSSEIESPKNSFYGMGDPKLWLIHSVEEVPGSSGGFASAPAWQDHELVSCPNAVRSAAGKYK